MLVLSRFAGSPSVTKLWICTLRRYIAQDASTNLPVPRAQNEISNSSDRQYKLICRRVKDVRSSLALPYQEDLPSEEYSAWRHVLAVKDIETAVNSAGGILPQAPTWVILYLLSTKVNTPGQTLIAEDLARQHFPKAHPSIQPSLLILVTRFLAKRQTSAPMANIVGAFLMLDMTKPSLHFNLLLQAMSRFRSTTVLAKLTVQILDAMKGRQIRVHSRTYRTLLSNELVTLELAKVIQGRMVYEGFIPHAEHLEAFIGVFGKHGKVRAAASYLNRLQALKTSRGELAPFGVELGSHGARPVVGENTANTRQTTQFLRSFDRHGGSAFDYLRGLMSENRSVARLDKKESRLPITSSHRPSSISLHGSLIKNWKKTLHVSDWSTALYSLSRDPKISSTRFLEIFERSRQIDGYRPTVATYTVMLRGLTRKGDFTSAFKIWNEMTTHKLLKLDAVALTVSVEVLVGSGKPLVALKALVERTGLLQDTSTRRFKCTEMNIILVNAFMSALLKAGRPDIVLLLWDVCTPLFGVYPNTETLTSVLRAARDAARLDRSLRGVMAQVKRLNPFATERPSPDYSKWDRYRLYRHIEELLGGPDINQSEGSVVDKPQVSSLWHGYPAAQRAIGLFRSIVLGNFPHLEHVPVPASAVWSDNASSVHPVRDFVTSMIPSHIASSDNDPVALGPVRQDLQADSSTPSKEPRTDEHNTNAYPQIVPNEKAFAAYIKLLGSQFMASEIPRTLVWMRELDIVPTKQNLRRALACWAEVGHRGPIIERYSRSEYDKLWVWLEHWLGKDNLPTPAQIGKEFVTMKIERGL